MMPNSLPAGLFNFFEIHHVAGPCCGFAEGFKNVAHDGLLLRLSAYL